VKIFANTLIFLLIAACLAASLAHMLSVYQAYLLQTGAFLLLHADGKSRDAEILLNEAIERFPQDFQNHWLKAQIAMNRGQMGQAEKYLLSLLESFDCYTIREALARVYSHGQKDKHLHALLHMYRYYYLFGDHLADLRHLLEDHLAALITREQHAQARDVLRPLVPILEADGRMRYLVGVFHAMGGRCGKAVELFHRFYLHFRNKRLRTCFVPCLLKGGEREWARRVIEVAGVLTLDDPYSQKLRKAYEQAE